MNITQAFSMAIKSIFGNKMRSFLTMLGIIIGVASVITLVSVINGYTQKSMEQFKAMYSNKININYWAWNKDYTDDIIDFCATLSEELDGVTPNQSTRLKVRYKNKTLDTNLYFGNDKFDVCMGTVLERGRTVSYSDNKGRVKVCVIGSRVAQELFGFSNPVNQKIRINGTEYTVIGVYQKKFDNQQYTNDDMVLVPYSLQRNITGSKTVNNFIAKAKNPEMTQVAVTKIQEFLKPKFTNEYDFWVNSNNEWIAENDEFARMATLIVGGIAGISLLVGGIGIMNIMLVSVTERTREIGIRMAIGARRRDIISQFLIEAATISACGGVIGILLGAFGSAVLGAAMMKSIILPTPMVTIGAFLFSVLLGIFFGFYPASKASKLHPIEALRAQ